MTVKMYEYALDVEVHEGPKRRKCLCSLGNKLVVAAEDVHIQEWKAWILRTMFNRVCSWVHNVGTHLRFCLSKHPSFP